MRQRQSSRRTEFARHPRPAAELLARTDGAGDAQSYRYIEDGIVLVQGRPHRGGGDRRRNWRRTLPAESPVEHHPDA